METIGNFPIDLLFRNDFITSSKITIKVVSNVYYVAFESLKISFLIPNPINVKMINACNFITDDVLMEN